MHAETPPKPAAVHTPAEIFVRLIFEVQSDMSIGSVSYGGDAQATAATKTSAFQQRKTEFDALAQALSCNDLAGAQAAFAKLQSDPRMISASHNFRAPVSMSSGGTVDVPA